MCPGTGQALTPVKARRAEADDSGPRCSRRARDERSASRQTRMAALLRHLTKSLPEKRAEVEVRSLDVGGLIAVVIIGADAVRQIIKFKDPPELPALPYRSARAPAR